MIRLLRVVQSVSVQFNNNYALKAKCEPVIKRWAGHSKWANIKHQKGVNDAERMKIFSKLTRMIKIAITEGKDVDPKTNIKLAQVIEQCKRANMPGGTITNAIKNSSTSKSTEVQGILYLRGPGRCAFLIEVASNNIAHFKNQFTTIAKKNGFKYDNTVVHDFLEKGVILCSPLKEGAAALDDAMEHAITIGMEEVTLNAETGKLRFECSPEITLRAKKGLEDLGYTVDSAVKEFIPLVKVSLNDDQVELVSKFLFKADVLPEIMSMHDNID